MLGQTAVPRFDHTATNSPPKATVSLTMIVRDEERNLPLCLQSVRGLFNEIVIVDTGSQDRTKEIALQFGARLIDFAWNDDFATARNISLANACSDYVFWLDADDLLDPPETKKLQALLKTLPADPKSAYVMRCASDREGDGSAGQLVTDHVRLFPLRDDVRWVYRVHEQILPDLLKANLPTCWTDITIRHTGYADENQKAKKRQRNWDILIRDLAIFPNDGFLLFNLGIISFERQQWREALEFFGRSFANTPHSPSSEPLRRKLFGMLAWTYQLLGNLQESLRICNIGLSVDSEDAELLFRKAVAYRYLGSTKEAEACWRRILSLERPEKFCSIDLGIYGHLTRRNLAIIAGERGDRSEAQVQWLAVLSECPGDSEAMRQLKALVA
jgi:glycosyltransferase involved in cell wall biosynthesis